MRFILCILEALVLLGQMVSVFVVAAALFFENWGLLTLMSPLITAVFGQILYNYLSEKAA